MSIVIKEAISETEREMALGVRLKVFIEEQGINPEREVDQFEKSSHYFLALLNDIPVGAGRMRLKDSYCKFERIATLKECRGKGVGKKMMEFMHSYAHNHYPQFLPFMHAQKSALSFYEKIGWEAVGDEFWEEEISHKVLIYPPKDPTLLANLKTLTDRQVLEVIKKRLKNN